MDAWLIAGTPWLRALLGFVFLLAAVSKLRDPGGFAAALGALGIKRPGLAKSLRIGVPLAEAGLGAWLWTGWGSLFAAVTAAVALVFLTVALLDLRRQGYAGTCGCFIGDTGGVGGLQIVRNAILFVLALWIGLGAYVAPSGQTLPLWQRLLPLAALATASALGAYTLLRRRARPAATGGTETATAEEPEAETAPGMDLTDLAGEPVALGQPRGDAQLVVFARGKCPGCLRDRDLLNRLSARLSAFEPVIVCGGDLDSTKAFASEVKPPVRVVADPRWQTAIAWQVSTTPFSVLVDHHGQVRARGQLEAILSLLMPRVEARPRYNEFVA